MLLDAEDPSGATHWTTQRNKSNLLYFCLDAIGISKVGCKTQVTSHLSIIEGLKQEGFNQEGLNKIFRYHVSGYVRIEDRE